MLLALALAACGGRHHGSAYAQATSAEQTCCENLSGAGRDQCLAAIVRVSDPEIQRVPVTERTYGCMTDHFSCDPQTGHATAASAQAQLDCIEQVTE